MEVEASSINIDFGLNTLVEGCAGGTVTFSVEQALADDLTIAFTSSGNATSGSDYTTLPGFITLEAGETSVSLNVDALEDDTNELSEQIIISYINEGCGAA